VNERAGQINFLGEIQSQGTAKGLVKEAGDFVIVKRIVLRSIVMKCPCGCGDDLVINLDPRVDKTWQLYSKNKKFTIYPSIWRDNRCESHFIIWNSKIYWCDYESLWEDSFDDDRLSKRILKFLKNNPGFYPFHDIAQKIGEIPWGVLEASRKLVKNNFLIEGEKNSKGSFSYKI